jgi:flagellum-specific peptidoglycan hydrolase FlgJ
MNTNLSSTPLQPAPLFILDELAECKNTDSTQESALVLVKESTLLRRKMDKYSHLLKSMRHALRWSQLKRQFTKESLYYLTKKHWQKVSAASLGLLVISNLHLSPQTSVAEASLFPYGQSSPSSIQTTKIQQSEFLQQNYIERFAKVAQAEMDKYNIPASVILAMAILQSNYGQSNLALKGNNHFNIPCQENHLSEGLDGAFKLEGTCFVHYTNAWTSFRANSLWMRNNFDYLIKTKVTDCKRWVENMEATHTEGASELSAIINKYNLTQFDTPKKNV